MNVQHCDICYTDKDVERMSFIYDRRMDAAGSMDNQWETFDLCPKCEIKIYRKLINLLMKENKNEFYVNGIIIKLIKQKMKK